MLARSTTRGVPRAFAQVASAISRPQMQGPAPPHSHLHAPPAAPHVRGGGARPLFTAATPQRQRAEPSPSPDLMGIDLSIGGNHPTLRNARHHPAGAVIGRVAFIPLMKGQGSDPTVLFVSKKPKSTSGYVTIEPFTGDVCEGETMFNASRRFLHEETGLSASKDCGESTALLYKEPFSSPTEQRFMAVEVDMKHALNQGVHPEDKYQLAGDEICVLRAPMSRMARDLNHLASEGRVIDPRLHVFAVGAEQAFAASGAGAGMSRISSGVATGLGAAWLVASMVIGGAFMFGNSFGATLELRSTKLVKEHQPQ
mmetsp:Transcript_35422/g.87098  ORF Transcript_35422/g.87098 Transcript_35422/m.87098 type:complete len:312 (+) Transcript_35422:67-1002(+)